MNTFLPKIGVTGTPGTSVRNELMPEGLDLKELKELIAQAHN